MPSPRPCRTAALFAHRDEHPGTRLVRIGAGFVLVLVLSVAVPASGALPGQVSVHPGYPSWLFYHLGGPFFLAGPGDPEGFLYRGTRNTDGTRNGDQQELLDKLVPTGANSIYLMAVRSHGGDGDSTQNPFVDNDPSLGLNQTVLDQWESWFTQMDSAGVTIFFFLYDDGSLIWNTGDSVGADEARFTQDLVDRFEHLRHLVWVVAEEYQERYSAARVSAIAAEIKAADDHDHPVAVHKLSGLDFSEFADDPALDQFAIQYNVATADELHGGIGVAWDDAAGRYNLNLAEAADWGGGATSRQKAWASALAGAYVMAFEMDIDGTPVADLEDLGRLRAFMEATDFYTMEPRDDLASEDTDYVLAREGKSYIVYARAGSGSLGLRDLEAGRYLLRWLDIASGDEMTQTDLDLDAGAQSWSRPAGIGSEATVYALRLDGPNDRPVTLGQSLMAFGTEPLPVTLGFLDPDGPGPHAYSIVDGPDHGSLTGAAPDLTYTATAGFVGNDALTWKVNDGIDDSDPAIVAITVGGNEPPTAEDFSLVGYVETPLELPFGDHSVDPEGQPLTFGIVTPPEHGTVTLNGGEWTYAPDVGFFGSDSLVWQASDGSSESAPALASLAVAAEVFHDPFDRADSPDIGNGWSEVEIAGEAGIEQESMMFDSLDESDRPLVRRGFAPQSDGTLYWRFDLGFERTGSEGTYAFHMQLGQGSAMSDLSPDESGVAVHLIWGGPNSGMSDHERLGYVLDSSVTELAPLSGPHTLTVEVDLATEVYAVLLDDLALAAGVPFDAAVPIDTVRFYADSLHSQNFASRWVDDLRIDAAGCSAPDGVELTLADDTVTGIEAYEVCGTIHVGPNWSVANGGAVTLTAAGSVAFENGVTVERDGRLTVSN